ncbi:MAG: zinc-binding alcohol dehydrogenase family protein [Gammaproteobacteria bacterium]|nr:zinc-binding alcohol dehydrogenase family protein [Gammaproteobacteria bacterium]MBU1554978.1 zinc-binding alcohol dehydrogenase family protein [Gammaproteobacteria bacterium]MBU2070498.1 zinc-binding alcohol dehydrogenase family protein [Gammaproteobacteria bacterium]MBU2185299.1 zinc-binding alcohol dehydrogenase family protein [Gammaproteobacteria bacterium]MBU2205090.1 zinc-binding alcohol dehydrogenase family protein [Gammaproteobacteria bacterium]
MKAVAYQQSLEATDPLALQDITLADPVAVGRDILVRVAAVSVNPVDTKIRKRVQPAPGEYKVLGWDAAGEVVAVGEDVSLFKPGDKVYYAGSLTRPGSNSELQLVDERIAGVMPDNLSFAEAAALPLTAITAWELLFDRLEIQQPGLKHPRPVLLVTGAAGGVGSILIQLARQLTTATIIATASRPESKQWVSELGAHYVLDHSQPLLPQLQALDLSCVSHVASLTHTDQHYAELVQLLAPQGKLALIDDPAAGIDIMPLKQKSISLHWEFMFTRAMFGTPDLQAQHQLLTDLSRLIQQGQIKTTLKQTLGTINAANLRSAHQLLESGKAIGKVVLQGW